MSVVKPEARATRPRRARGRAGRAAGVGALAAALALCTACSGGSGTNTSSASTASTPSVTATATVTSTTAASTASTTTATSPTTPSPTATAHCPTLKTVTTTQPPLPCTSAALIAAAATKAGLSRHSDTTTIVPGVRLLDYRRIAVSPKLSARSVLVFHHSNGDAVYAICEGVVAKTLDPVLAVCTDVGASTRTDRPTVRAWALRAENAIAKSATALPVLTSGSLMFIACQNSLYPKSGGSSSAFEMNLIVQHAGLHASLSYCTGA